MTHPEENAANAFYKAYFGQLLLCLRVTHEGVDHELCFLKHLFPHMKHTTKLPEEDAVPYFTEYVFPPRPTYEVLDVGNVKHRAALFRPPSLLLADGKHAAYILAPDIYGRF
jgi:hypothetical protein